MKCNHVDAIGETGTFLNCDRCRKPQSEGYYVEHENDKEEKELSFTAVVFLCDDCIIELSKKYPMKVFGGLGKYLGKWTNAEWKE